MYENRMLWKIFVPRRKRGTEEERKLYNQELHNLHSVNIIRVVQSRRMRLAEHAAAIGDRRNECMAMNLVRISERRSRRT
jgi:hypothetical protein